MRRLASFALLVSLVLAACQAVTLPITGLLSGTPTLPPQASPVSPATGQPATPVPPRSPSPEPTPSLSLTPTSTQVAGDDFEVRLHPDGGLYVGDQVSLEVIAPPGVDLSDSKIQVTVEQTGSELAPAEFGAYGIAGRYQATLTWAWDTAGLEPGDYTLDFSIQPASIQWVETVTLAPAAALPSPAAQARWATTESDCCILYYITGTAAERDLPALEQMVDTQAEDAVRRLGTDFEEAIPVVFLSRVLGHGGFANNAISISYLDRNYAGSSPELVLHHEMIHILDSRLGGELRPTLFVEGLAVYLSGGHFKPEMLMPRSAALLEMGRYLPLVSLADSFYPAQHETGYLEAASLIEYMVNEWGWEAFSAFYRDIHPAPDKSQSKAIDAALQEHFGLSFAGLEDRFLGALRHIPVTAQLRDDVRLTLSYYDTVRRYQAALDPSAYFSTAWLPDSEEMRKRGLTADYLRHPSTPENLALEGLLVSAGKHLEAEDYVATSRVLEAVNAVLDARDAGRPEPFIAHPLAADAFAIVQVLDRVGYEVQRVDVEDGAGQSRMAQAWAIRDWPALAVVNLVKESSGWKIR